MKKLLAGGLVLGALATAQAQLFSPESVGGAAFGALAGGIIGGNGCHLGGTGAAIGAGAGFLLGTVVHEANKDSYSASGYYYPAQAVVYTVPPAAPVAVQQTPAAAPQAPAPVVPPNPVSPMSSANSLFGR
jgi:hypothetical protein